MTRCHVDFETRSTVDLRTRGSTVYAQHWTTSPLMLAFIDDTYETVFDFMGTDHAYAATSFPYIQEENDAFLHASPPELPEALAHAIHNDYTFVAHNARFEQDIFYWICHKRWGWPMPKRWSCTAARARYWGLRASLDGAAGDLELPIQKLTGIGEEFIKTFCIPRKYKGPKKNGIIAEMWAEPHEKPLHWSEGKRYCLYDAKTEKGIDELLPDLPPFEQAVFDLDFQMNTHGIPIDLESVGKAVHFSDHYTQQAVLRFNAITSVNPTQRDRVLEYLNQREEMEKLPNLRTKTLNRICRTNLPPDLHDVIDIRLDAARASVKKLDAMRIATSSDGFARGCFLYYGAHTGRWSAKRLQPHNFIRGNKKLASPTFRYLESDAWEKGLDDNGIPHWINNADLMFPRPLKALSHSMRGFIKAPDGHIICSGDYSQIEARVLAWLANCESLLHSYATGEDVYVRFAADHMYRRRYDEYFGPDGSVLPNFADERQRAKSAVLGCGFQLGAAGYLEYCDNMDIILTPDEAQSTIDAYRGAYPEISDYSSGLWARVNWCAIEAVINEGQTINLYGTEITFHVHRVDSERWWLICTLPSGRHIAYYRPKCDTVNKWGKTVLTYRTEWMGRTQRESTYGGKITENIVQAIARDICAQGALNAAEVGFKLIMLVHDELVSLVKLHDIPNYEAILYNKRAAMLTLPDCYKGLPLDCEVKLMDRYSK